VRVTLADGSKAWVRPVHPAEAFLDDERISITSPLGSAILGARPGDVLTVEAPVGAWECSVLSIEGVRKRRVSRRK
jgi:transcription elongation GreA/GreB family factor